MSDKDRRKNFDILIVGSGIAGLSAAITAAKQDLSVAVLSKEADIRECNTRYAQGGIVYKGINDSKELLIQDIMKAGDDIVMIF